MSKNLPQFYDQNSKCLLKFPPEAAESLSPSLTSFTLVGEMMDSLPPSSVIFRVGDGRTRTDHGCFLARSHLPICCRRRREMSSTLIGSDISG